MNDPQPEQETNDYPALFLQASQKLAALAAERREIEALVPTNALTADMPLVQRINVMRTVLARTTEALSDSGSRLQAVAAERAHLRQELDSVTTRAEATHRNELERQRVRRLFLEGLRGQPYEHDVVALLERADEGGTTL